VKTVARLDWRRARVFRRSRLNVKDETEIRDNDVAARWLKRQLLKQQQRRLEGKTKSKQLRNSKTRERIT
jgi:hypothetical protein